MAQLQKGFEYDSSNPVKNIVTDDNLNALVANATLLSGAITEQTANSITADTDIMLLSKAGGLIKQTKAQFTDTINSNIANINTVNAALVDADDVDTVDATLTGNLAVGGNSALTGNLAVTGALTSTGVANFTGTLQINSKVVYGMYEKTVTHLATKNWSPYAPYSNTYTTQEKMYDGSWSAQTGSQMSTFYTETFTVPANEQWEYEFVACWSDDADGSSLQGVAVYVDGVLANAYRYITVVLTQMQFSTKIVVPAGVDRKIEIKVTKSVSGYISWGVQEFGAGYNIQPWYKVVTKFITA